MKVLFAIALWLGLGFCGSPEALAGRLGERVAAFPQWHGKPPVAPAKGDLVYPDWMAGNWQVTETLEEMVAPFAPDLVTPGFEGNRRYLKEAIAFPVRFNRSSTGIIADRAFNSLNIGNAYLGEGAVRSVKVDPDNPNRQITQLREGGEFVSVITKRGKEIPAKERFITTEVSQQIFRSPTQLYLNEVETTTQYQHSERDRISAEQMTAIYLSPRDPDYFKAGNAPIALYRYHLELSKLQLHETEDE
ncbi:hypothetical protein H6G50_10445 [Oscillatoria sp. FACHB-1406]|nr:hypothetical protein [Oscillatoria sp. FACHB-1406]